MTGGKTREGHLEVQAVYPLRQEFVTELPISRLRDMAFYMK